MFVQQYALRFKGVRSLIGLPPDWPNIGTAPQTTGTHPLAKYLEGNFSFKPGDKVNDAYISFSTGLRQADAPPPPVGAPPEALKSAAKAVFSASAEAQQVAAAGAATAQKVIVAKPKAKKGGK